MPVNFPAKKDNLVIEVVSPLVEHGKYAVHRVPGEYVTVQADIFRHSHEKYDAAIEYRHHSQKKWERAPMKFVDNDLWEGSFQVQKLGFYQYKIIAWTISPADIPTESGIFEARVDSLCARQGTWYEMWPKSQGKNPNKSATWADCINRLDYIVSLGFDTVYLVPFHPVGETNRKGANNALKAKPGDPGCPYAVGNSRGGHFAVDPELGTMEDFENFASACKQRSLKLAIDIALNCSPDHPYVKQHPEWFFHEADGSIKFAENPPKKYEDIYPFDYYNENYQELWKEIKKIILFWADKGFDIFRIDNPHTKPFPFWEWLIGSVKEERPELVFLAEAFTRPKIMKRLAKVGFEMSYTYFTWREQKGELEDYFRELTTKPVCEYMRGILFPTTPDIFLESFNGQGPAIFKLRYFLAATLSSLTGMYNGYELCENEKNPAKEELFNSEKYQYKVHNWSSPINIKEFLRKVNFARKQQSALMEYDNLRFHSAENSNIIAYSKRDKKNGNTVLCIANLDVKKTHDSFVHLNLAELGLSEGQGYTIRDLLSGQSYLWRGSKNYVEINPEKEPCHLFVVENGID
ncbi:alpha-amylase [Fibrobacteria bacterium R8-3-H12]